MTTTATMFTKPKPPNLEYPELYEFPAFFTRQPNDTTWAHQRSIWAAWVLSYCRAHKIWKLQLSDALETELFYNRNLNRRFKQRDAAELLEYMVTEGDVEWEGVGKATAIVYWRKPEEWANVIYEWIDSTGQKGSVLTLYEISEGDLTRNQEFHTIDPYVLRKALDFLVKRSLAQVFGANEEMGVKFF